MGINGVNKSFSSVGRFWMISAKVLLLAGLTSIGRIEIKPSRIPADAHPIPTRANIMIENFMILPKKCNCCNTETWRDVRSSWWLDSLKTVDERTVFIV